MLFLIASKILSCGRGFFSFYPHFFLKPSSSGLLKLRAVGFLELRPIKVKCLTAQFHNLGGGCHIKSISMYRYLEYYGTQPQICREDKRLG